MHFRDRTLILAPSQPRSAELNLATGASRPTNGDTGNIAANRKRAIDEALIRVSA